jgi:hypothetical protein
MLNRLKRMVLVVLSIGMFAGGIQMAAAQDSTTSVEAVETIEDERDQCDETPAFDIVINPDGSSEIRIPCGDSWSDQCRYLTDHGCRVFCNASGGGCWAPSSSCDSL